MASKIINSKRFINTKTDIDEDDSSLPNIPIFWKSKVPKTMSDCNNSQKRKMKKAASHDPITSEISLLSEKSFKVADDYKCYSNSKRYFKKGSLGFNTLDHILLEDDENGNIDSCFSLSEVGSTFKSDTLQCFRF